MKKGLLSLIGAGIITALILLPTNANAQDNNVKASVDVVRSENQPVSFIRPNVFYALPLGIKGYTFGEFYNEGNNYFSKTILEGKLDDNSAAGLVGHVVTGSGFNTQAGLGLNAVVPSPEGSFVKLSFLPIFADSKGRMVNNKAVGGYFGSVNLPLGINLSSFGEINLDAKGGPKWGYGEISLSKNITDKLAVAYNPLLKNQGKLNPRVEHAVRASYTF